MTFYDIICNAFYEMTGLNYQLAIDRGQLFHFVKNV